MSYTDVFGGSVVQPSEVSFRAILLTANQALFWPTQFQDGPNVTARIMNVTATGNFVLNLPDARLVSPGQDLLINNIGVSTFRVFDAAGVLLVTIGAGQSYYIFLTDNTTLAGLWSTTPFAGGAPAVTSIGLVSTTPEIIVGGSPSPITNAGTFDLSLGPDLTSLVALNTQGYVVKNGLNSWISRNITSSTNITVSNNDGVAGDSQILLNDNIIGINSIVNGNFTWTSGSIVNSGANEQLSLSAQSLISINSPGFLSLTAGSIINVTSPVGMVFISGTPLIMQSPSNLTSVGFSVSNATISSRYIYPLAKPTANNQVLASSTSGQMSWIDNIALNPPQGSNRIINGDFQIWQNGNTFSVTSATIYCADMWNVRSNGAIVDVNKISLTNGDSGLRTQRRAGEVNTTVILTSISLPITNCNGMQGSYAVISFSAAAGANFSAASSIISVTFTSGTNVNSVLYPSYTATTSESINQSITTTFNRYSFITSLIPATQTQAAVVFLFFPTGTAGANDYFDIVNVQIEIFPSVPTGPSAFQRLTFAQQLNNCLPFYMKSFAYGTAAAQNIGIDTGEQIMPTVSAGATANIWTFVPFPQYGFLDAGIFTTYNPAAANAQIRNEITNADCSATTVIDLSRRGFALSFTGDAGSAAGNKLGVHWTYDCRLA